MKVALGVWLLAVLLTVLLIWDYRRHEAMRVCVMEEAHAWIDDACCERLAGPEALGAVRCEAP